MFVALAAGIAGCGPMHIAMNSTSVLDLSNKHIPCRITLFLDSEFQNYHWEGFSKAELRGLDYDLGSASKNLFVRAFTLASDGVTVVESRPTYPVSGGGDGVLVVHPRIGAFGEKHNAFKRNTDYYAEITYYVTVYDRTGKIVLENDYSTQRAEMGSIDVYRNHAAPAEKAMAQAVTKIIDDISKLTLLK
jgi:hypothetical protein